MPSSDLTDQLATILGPDTILSAEGYAVDGVAPQVVVRPDDRQGISELLRWASSNEVRVFPRGGGVLTGLGNVPSDVGVALDLTRLNRVVDYQPADLTVTVEAGIPLESLRRELAQGDKYVPLEAPLPHRATIGGILATGYSGPMRYSYGLPRDWIIGVNVVGTDGLETKAGGRVVKNVTGYDLNKLYTGSLGTLGIMVEASFKLAPTPDTWSGVLATFPSMAVAIEASRSLVGEVYAPQGLQVLSRQVAERLDLDLPQNSEAVALAFMSGRPRAVARRLADTIRLLGDHGVSGVEKLDEPVAKGLLARLTDLPWNDADPPSLGLKISLSPNNVGGMVEAVGNAGELDIIADPGFGVVQLYQWAGESAGEPKDADTVELIESVRRAARGLSGAVAVEICPPQVKAGIDVWEGSASEAELEIMRRVKRNFDPTGILNPGRFIGGL